MNLPQGLWVALPTPFDLEGAVDLHALRGLVRRLAGAGVDVLVPLGTTGEGATLEDDERDAVIAACRDAADLPLVVGCGHAATHVAARHVQRARALGAAGALVVTPYYNKPTQDGLVAHYQAIAAAAPGLPLVAYNVPSRTGVSLSLAALARIWQIDEVVALKESAGDPARYREIAAAMPAGKMLLAGDDHLVLDAVAAGARGLVSVVGNVAPLATAAMVRAALTGDAARAEHARAMLAALMRALFLESNPIPLKAALDLLGLAGRHLRLPLTPAAPPTVAELRRVLAHADLGVELPS